MRFIPKLKRNLISLGTLDDVGFRIKVKGGQMKVYHESSVVFKVVEKNWIHVLLGNFICNNVIASDNCSNVTMLWHRCLGHISFKDLHILNKNNCFGSVKIYDLEFCEHDIMGKQTKVSFQTTKHTNILEYVHSDL